MGEPPPPPTGNTGTMGQLYRGILLGHRRHNVHGVSDIYGVFREVRSTFLSLCVWIYLSQSAPRKPSHGLSTVQAFLLGFPSRKASDCIDKDLQKLLSEMLDGCMPATIQAMDWDEEEDFWEADAAKGDSALLTAPATISPATSVRPTPFVAWAAQGTADAEKIRSIYALFATADEDTIG